MMLDQLLQSCDLIEDSLRTLKMMETPTSHASDLLEKAHERLSSLRDTSMQLASFYGVPI
jgi:hypothetical protein